jgi:dienelactone hydrolase
VALHARLFIALAALAAASCAGADEPGRSDPAAVAAFDGAPLSGAFPVGVVYKREIGGAPPGAMIVYPAGETGLTLTSDTAPTFEAQDVRRRFGPDAAATLAKARGPLRPGAPIRAGRYPVVVFMPGAGLGAMQYRLLLADLASHGRIVVALYPGTSPPAGEARYREAAQEMSRAAAASDFAEFAAGPTVLVGHSLGGAAAVLALAQTPSAVAAVNIDGDTPSNLAAPAPHRPILYITGNEDGDAARSRDRRARDWATIAGPNPAARRLAMPDMRHLDVTDAASLPPALTAKAREDGRSGPSGGAAIRSRIVSLILGLPLTRS